jgi:aerobic-type carbon monoxide dehydrogenase small subunit (CoxS/CutS family)
VHGFNLLQKLSPKQLRWCNIKYISAVPRTSAIAHAGCFTSGEARATSNSAVLKGLFLNMKKKPENSQGSGFSRRSFLKGVGGVGLGSLALPSNGIGGLNSVADENTSDTVESANDVLSGNVPVELKINGKPYRAKMPVRTTLLDALRNHLDLTGSKLVCDRGTCGACSVILDGKIVTSCMVLALDAQGHEIRTIEGLAQGDKLHPVQQAFIECDALQCGFCTPGMIMACVNELERHPEASETEIREAISGYICRCGTYNRIFEAMAKAQKMISGAKAS